METTYKLYLREDEDGHKEYITARQKKLFDYAVNWCLENNWNSCRVNRTYYNFDFEKLEVRINGIGYGNNNTYKIVKVVR